MDKLIEAGAIIKEIIKGFAMRCFDRWCMVSPFGIFGGQVESY